MSPGGSGYFTCIQNMKLKPKYEIDTKYEIDIKYDIYIYTHTQGDSLARGPKQIWGKYSRIWRNAFKCAWM